MSDDKTQSEWEKEQEKLDNQLRDALEDSKERGDFQLCRLLKKIEIGNQSKQGGGMKKFYLILILQFLLIAGLVYIMTTHYKEVHYVEQKSVPDTVKVLAHRYHVDTVSITIRDTIKEIEYIPKIIPEDSLIFRLFSPYNKSNLQLDSVCTLRVEGR